FARAGDRDEFTLGAARALLVGESRDRADVAARSATDFAKEQAAGRAAGSSPEHRRLATLTQERWHGSSPNGPIAAATAPQKNASTKRLLPEITGQTVRSAAGMRRSTHACPGRR